MYSTVYFVCSATLQLPPTLLSLPKIEPAPKKLQETSFSLCNPTPYSPIVANKEKKRKVFPTPFISVQQKHSDKKYFLSVFEGENNLLDKSNKEKSKLISHLQLLSFLEVN